MTSVQDLSPAPNSQGDRMASLFLALIASVMLLCVIYGMNRGIDITDESFYLLGYTSPQETTTGPYSFRILLGKMAAPFHPDVLFFRILRLICITLTALIASLGVYVWTRRPSQYAPSSRFPLRFIDIFFFLLIGEFLLYIWLPQTPGYNDLNNYLLISTSSLFLLRVKSATRGRALAFSFVIGLVIGMIFFVKFSTSIMFMAAVIVTGGVLDIGFRRNMMQFLANSLCVVIGVSTSFLLYFAFFEPPRLWIVNFVDMSTALAQLRGGLSFSILIVQIRVLIIAPLKNIFLGFLPFTAAVFFFYFRNFIDTTSRRGRLSLIALIILFLGCFAATFLVFRISPLKLTLDPMAFNDYIFYELPYIALAYALVAVFASVLTRTDLRRTLLSGDNAIVLVLAAFLLMMPLIGNSGHGGALTLYHSHLYYTALFMTGLLLLFVLSEHIKSLPLALLFVVVPALCVFLQFMDGYMYAPYRSFKTSLWEKTLKNDVTTRGRGLLLDVDTYTLLKRATDSLTRKTRFTPGGPMLALYHMNGFVYLLGGVSPGGGWFYESPNWNSLNCYYLSHSRLNLRDTIVLRFDPASEAMLQCMHTEGIAYPENYVTVDTITLPENYRILQEHPSAYTQIEILAPRHMLKD